MTTNAVDILKKRFGDSPERRAQIDEEKTKFSVACIVHDARLRAGFTQKQLAEKIDTKQSVISRLENADYDGHTLSMLKKVADALEMDLEVSLKPKNISKPKVGRHRRIRRFRRVASDDRIVACPI